MSGKLSGAQRRKIKRDKTEKQDEFLQKVPKLDSFFQKDTKEPEKVDVLQVSSSYSNTIKISAFTEGPSTSEHSALMETETPVTFTSPSLPIGDVEPKIEAEFREISKLDFY
ncbi:hypothetical protein FQR65_LT18716 [Abscondita terminalis]|nr:hypothetical protein FQR65_LT18716 [Abscondita terminalis]